MFSIYLRILLSHCPFHDDFFNFNPENIIQNFTHPDHRNHNETKLQRSTSISTVTWNVILHPKHIGQQLTGYCLTKGIRETAKIKQYA